jgi:hypothetical protein
MRQTGDDPAPDWIGSEPDNDGYRRRGVLGGQGRRGGRGDDDIHLETHELRREPGKLIRLSLGEPNFNSDVSALNPTEIVKPLLEPIHLGIATDGRSLVEIAELPNLFRRLRSGG